MGKRRKKILSAVLAGTMAVSLCQTVVADTNTEANKNSHFDENDLRLWYTKPSSQGAAGLTEDNMWQEYTLPIGNGDIGGNVYGEIVHERITFNEKTLWTGGPSDKRPNYNGGNKEYANDGITPMYEILQQVRENFALHTDEGDATASSLCNQLVGISDGYGAYQAWGEINLDFIGIDENNVTDYVRDLNLRNAISSVNYTYGDTEYIRENFVSHPDDVMVIRVEANGENKLNFDVSFPSKQGATTIVENDTITLEGEVSDNQLKYNSQLKIVSDDGEVTEGTDKLTVENATSATIYISAATDYKNDYPEYRTGETAEELDARVGDVIEALDGKSYEEVKADHIADYKSIFDRVDLDLGQALPNIPTDELLSGYGNNTVSEEARRALEVMFFQYGRYLTIASSREDSQLPSNLQGVWNNKNNPAWSSDYHMNVNLQMNYWPTYSTNMAECATPLVEYIDSLREPGRETARIYAGVESAKDENGEYIEANGFMAHTQNTPFGWTCPGWSFDWGWSPAAVPWILQNVWEMYEYTGDVEYMRDVIYPMMKEEVNLYENMLVWDEVQQRMVSSPTYSPEHGPRTVGNTYEQTLIWQLYEDTITAAETLGVDADLVVEWKDTQSKLDPIQIGDDGQIKEWFEETTLNSIPSEGYGHRHMSHLLGLFPGDSISVETPELLDAALVSLNNRTDQSTGWGMGQRINSWARAGEGNKAYELLTKQLKRVGTGQANGGGTYSNLWDAHPPFQIDGNFGATAGIAEMLMQSNMGYVYFLPALPDTWADGSYDGLLARGNFEVGAKWSNGVAYELTVKSNNGGEAVAKYAGLNLAKVTNSKGENIEFTVVEEDKISFNTEVGETYTITEIPGAEEKLDAPTGLTAERILDSSVNLSWDAVEGDNVTYNVYRQVNNGDVVLVAENISEVTFEDNNAQDILGTFVYSVSAVVNGIESNISSSVSVNDLRNMSGYIDDRDARISYSGEWGNWSESVNYAGTIKFIESPVGGETATLTFVGTGIEVISCTNHDRGKFEIIIDGVSQGEVSTYSASTVRQKVVYSNENLEYGKHTIVVKATNTKVDAASRTKVELDAFKVLDNSSVKPTSISVGTKSGITTVGKANSEVQMVATVLPNDAINKDVTWSVNDSTIATIDENGVLTTGEVNGTVRVTATSKDDASISGYVDITVALAEVNVNEVIVEDGYMDNTKNPDITWGGNWSVWAGESDRHHGGTKTESSTGATISYTFTGTGIEVYAQKHANFASFDISIDGKAQGNFSLAGSSTGDDQSLVAAFKDLENGEHTILMTAVARDGKNAVNLDYFKVLKPVDSEIVNKSELQNVIEEHSHKAEANYTAETWSEFKNAYNNAVTVMNNDEATVEEVANAVATLTEKANALVAQEAQGPVIPAGSKVEAIGVESSTLVLTWPVIDEAVVYEIYEGDVKIGETVSNYYRVSNLNENTEYTFVVKAVNEAGRASAFEAVTAITTVGADKERPSNIEAINVNVTSETTAEVTWSEATDNVAVVAYRVYLNGVLQGEVSELTYTLEELNKDINYTVKVIAVDAAGNTSLVPASVNFTTSDNGEEVPPTPEVDKSVLQVVVDNANTLIESEYTQESWSKLTTALQEANKVLDNEEATQEEVDTAKSALEAAIEALVEKPVTPPSNVIKLHLEIAVETALEVTDEELSNVVPAVANEFKAALAEAQEILANDEATQEEVNASFDRLSNAMQMLEFKKGDKTALITLIERINGLNESEYIASTWSKMQDALTIANNVIADENAMEDEVSETYTSLLKSFLQLRLKPSKDKLEELINKAESLDSNKYTVASFKAVEKALEEANKVFASEDATSEEIAKAEANLRNAMNSLQSNAGNENNNSSNAENSNGSNNTSNNSTANNSGNSGSTSNSGKLPQTGGRSAMAVGLVGGILAVAGIVLFKRKR
ncbi:glycosyl hydrolase family 95 catalytic domain-containing protein [Clostridium celatum]|uniref:glycosyl hydrolase family 95 catalytic domain-containing protein n=1 Tax=Clostridium celatum TaxID=36834 RepID=UPI00319E93A9